MENRIKKLFSEKKEQILSVYYTAGFPNLDDTGRIAIALEKSGADVIEIGIPFSDPIADGPTIQSSNQTALENGMTLRLLLEQVSAIRKKVEAPIILMGYLNPIMQYGMEAFCKDAREVGIDGVILPDLPMEEYIKDYQSLFEDMGLLNIFLISPTTAEDRIRKIDEGTNGFIYTVSSSGITGAKGAFLPDQIKYFERVQAMHLKNPFLIGFGIANHETFSSACEYGAGAIVGSAFVNLLKNSTDLEFDIDQFIKTLKG